VVLRYITLRKYWFPDITSLLENIIMDLQTATIMMSSANWFLPRLAYFKILPDYTEFFTG
jgi:hypothetical protein